MAISPVSSLQAATLIVSPTPGFGNYTTIQAAINAAVSGQTILIKPGVYTENPALKAGVNLTAFTSDDDTPNVTILGKCTFSGTGSISISNIMLKTNADYFLEITGAGAVALTVNGCNLICDNHSGYHCTNSNAATFVDFTYCFGNINTTGIAYFVNTNPGVFQFLYCNLRNDGLSVTNSTSSAGLLGFGYTSIQAPITTSGTSSIGAGFSQFQMATSTTALTIGGSGINAIDRCGVNSINAICMTLNSGCGSNLTAYFTGNATAINGAGTLRLTNLSFELSAGVTCPITKALERHGISVSSTQPAFSATKSAPANGVVGNGATVTVLFDNVLYDQNSDFNAGTGVFTAPYTGRYSFTSTVTFTSTTNAMNGYSIALVATGQTFTSSPQFNAANGPTSNTIDITQQLSMTAGDTIHVEVTITGGAANNANIAGSGSPYVTFFSGHLMF